eukprot:CAMPEP_0184862070 /NCGR_PEP_ID=MMETSP0580-20130426/6606_1 /TAXON_ID=1118495 /ORGANISM="Dactyliosolen fragilissimus" /LENGTH=711 /DNA_ID=CAMNT_0027359793 /DNA_START=453 /DNA_END=2588 /DNA_ORIENTATION=+
MPSEYVPRFVDYVKTQKDEILGSNLSNRSNHNTSEFGGTGGGDTNTLTNGGMTETKACKGTNTNKSISVLLMEYLPGEDMHHLRDRHCQLVASRAIRRDKDQQFPPHHHRRVAIHDAVYLCSDIMLQLLKHMHNAGMIHRDVKPSNCVRIGTGPDDRGFKLVDFGLSKSFVVPMNSSYADDSVLWDKSWDVPPNILKQNNNSNSDDANKNETLSDSHHMPKGAMRKERPTAEFRGTSMYASLRVHQSKDYCRRDDIWGLLYVFCDLVSGGLPWMEYAARKDRNMCKNLKEWIHGERQSMYNDEKTTESRTDTSESILDKPNNENDNVQELLKGGDYHVSMYKQKTCKLPPDDPKFPKQIQPLAMASDPIKLNCLRKAFQHLSTLEFYDEPDYDLIQKCLQEFASSSSSTTSNHTLPVDDKVPQIEWAQPSSEQTDRKRRERRGLRKSLSTEDMILEQSKFKPTIQFLDKDDYDPLTESILLEAEREKQYLIDSVAEQQGNGVANINSMMSNSTNNSSNMSENNHLPLLLQFYLAQVEYNASQPNSIPIHLAMKDWMTLGSYLVYGNYDWTRFENGNHRTKEDEYRKEVFMSYLEICKECAKYFSNFCSRECFYLPLSNTEKPGSENGNENDISESNGNNIDNEYNRRRKKRKICVIPPHADSFDNDIEEDVFKDNSSATSVLVAFSKVMHGVNTYYNKEKSLTLAPPPAVW